MYGYEPPFKNKHQKGGFLSSLCGGSKKKNSKSNKKDSDEKKSSKHVDSTFPISNIQDIEEGVEGRVRSSSNFLFKEQDLKIILSVRQQSLIGK